MTPRLNQPSGPRDEMLPATSASQRTAYDRIGRRHVDLPAGYEFITAPDERAPVLRCPNWPECMCGDDCNKLAPEESPTARWVSYGLMIATGAVGIALMLYAGVQR